jgi:hypothetical protein
MLLAAKWDSGRRIRVSFLDDEAHLQERVKEVAPEWTGHRMANLKFLFVDDPEAGDIRVSFRYRGSWSVLGKTCLYITEGHEPTMNLDLLHGIPTEDQIRRVVLHEFGHALGLVHEHQSPAAGIQWNREQVIQELSGPPNYWTVEDIERNVFEPFDQAETNFTRPDMASIMVYPIPARWTLDGFSTTLNADLSPVDREFIGKRYPYDE